LVWARQTWKLSADPQFTDKVRDVVGSYVDPPEKALVLAVDEKSRMQASDRTAPMLPGAPARKNHDYMRRRHRHQDFLRFLKTIDSNTPKDLDLRLICDNYATREIPAIRTWLTAHPRSP
jgi:hypothetical protein